MEKRTIKIQVEEGLNKVIENLQNNGLEFLRFKDLIFETDTEIIKCRSPFWGNGSMCYEEKIAWEYLIKNYSYEKFKVAGFNGNTKFFKIK
jgi:hypothetical protein